MRSRTSFVLAVVVLLGGITVGAQRSGEDRQALRERIEQRYDVVPLSDGIALRPKTRGRDVRLIEVTDGAIAINGSTVSGRELRDRAGADAEAILRLSYLTAAEQRELFAPPLPAAVPDTPPVERAEPPAVEPRSSAPAPPRRARRTSGDRVRVFGDVVVHEDEQIDGEVIAVLGSVRVDGEVSDQVVAVLGSVNLGPSAVVRGDIVSVGGRVHRAAGAQAHRAVTEVSLGDSGMRVHMSPWFDDWGWGPFVWFEEFGALPRLVGTGIRACLLLLLAGIALVVARRSVDASAQRVSDNPVRATLIGLVAQVMILPVLIVTAIVLAISIVGIPLLLLLPFVVLFLIMMAVVGFTGTAAAIGGFVRRRFAPGPAGAFVSVAVGIFVILLPLLIGRMLAVAGWPATPLAFLLIATGFAVELLAWASGFGAVLTNAFTRWQARRAPRNGIAAPPVVS